MLNGMRYSISKMKIMRFTLSLVFLFVCTSLFGQDTAYKQTIQITSSYKPSLRKSVKIDLVATPLNADTSRPRLTYSIPAQNLFFSYNPTVLQPQTLTIDSALIFGTRNYVKAGFGSFTTPYVEGALGFGDAKTSLLKIYGDYTSSRGKIKYQDFSNLNVRADGSVFTGNNEAYGSFGIGTREYYQYGFDHNLFDYPKEDLRRSYRDMSLSLGFRNVQENDIGVNFDPHIVLHGFTREGKADESSLEAKVPFEKLINDNLKVEISFDAYINGYKEKASDLKVTEKLFQISPSVIYGGEDFNLHIGVTPSWNNGQSALLPNFTGEVKLPENIITVQGGWVGRYITNNFRTLSETNPYISDPVFLHNTKETQFFGGIKLSVGGHLNFNAKSAFIVYRNMPLFVNDDFDQRKFLILNESRMNNFQIHGDINYINQDKFSVTGGLDLNSYTGLKDNSKAWGLYPLRLTGSLRWNAFDQLILKADIEAFSGAKALLPGNNIRNMKGGSDLSVGAEFKINKMFSAWFDINNLFNSQYQYWNNYPVYGLQAIGGVIVRF